MFFFFFNFLFNELRYTHVCINALYKVYTWTNTFTMNYSKVKFLVILLCRLNWLFKIIYLPKNSFKSFFFFFFHLSIDVRFEGYVLLMKELIKRRVQQASKTKQGCVINLLFVHVCDKNNMHTYKHIGFLFFSGYEWIVANTT